MVLCIDFIPLLQKLICESKSACSQKKHLHRNKRKTCRMTCHRCSHGDEGRGASWVSSRSVKRTPQTATGAGDSFQSSTEYPSPRLCVNETGNLIREFGKDFFFSQLLKHHKLIFTNKTCEGFVAFTNSAKQRCRSSSVSYMRI